MTDNKQMHIVDRFLASMERLKMQFRIRSAVRDEAAIADRLGSIERQVLSAIGAAEAEKQGFAGRIESARSRTALLMGNEYSEYSDRDPKAERSLADAEGELVEAGKRIIAPRPI